MSGTVDGALEQKALVQAQGEWDTLQGLIAEFFATHLCTGNNRLMVRPSYTPKDLIPNSAICGEAEEGVAAARDGIRAIKKLWLAKRTIHLQTNLVRNLVRDVRP